MHFSFRRVEALPKLAWCAVLSRRDDCIKVFHGPWVETRDRFFLDGAWDGSFTEGGIDASYLFMGTGAKLTDDKVLFVTPCHILDKLHLYRTEDFLYVSSSMTFLLKRAGRRLDINHIQYESELLQQLHGLENHVASILLDNGDSMLLCRYRNIEIGSDLEFNILPKPEPPDFCDYAGYKTFLVNGLSSLTRNACDPQRAVRYHPLTTISTGYDSPACSAIATEIGCTEAVTVLNARDDYHFAYDGGTQIGERMGLHVQEYQSDDYKRLPGLPEAEFAALGDGGPDVVMAPMADVFRKRLLITGVHGDTVWNRKQKEPVSRDIVRVDQHGSTMSEFRMRVGFINVPLPFFGCLSQPSIHAISNSEEMAPWSVGGDYDRPIARRLAEEKGVARDSFGMQKLAVTVSGIGSPRNAVARMAQESIESFTRFHEENKKNRTLLKQTWHTFLFVTYRLWEEAHNRLGALFAWIPCPVPRRFRCNPLHRSFMLHWGIASIESRYEID